MTVHIVQRVVSHTVSQEFEGITFPWLENSPTPPTQEPKPVTPSVPKKAPGPAPSQTPPLRKPQPGGQPTTIPKRNPNEKFPTCGGS